ncbi:MipA/OmpV family protein [Pseudomonas sp. MOIL14HWK12:I2]|uniref:MipA/OmpV family protein n=1 Tax=Pseudomonas sp. MOIL14HWK12:I2 TaxID=1033994 RepID=UPI000407CBF9|nr:MipA/OmpV family protein [Pseudomonas sp. MOIL14HWK12:I2]
MTRTTLLLLLCLTPLAAQAADASPWGDHTDVSLGLVAGAVGRYMGSAAYRPQLLPLVVVQRGPFFADTSRGLGLQWQSAQGLTLSGALNYDFGRDDRDNASRPGADRLKGMGEVDGATVLDLNLSQALAPWLSLNAEGEWRLAGAQRGNRYRLGVEAIGLHTDQDTLALDLDAHASDSRFNQTYFGVTAAQSAASGFAPARLDRGIYAYSAALNWLHAFDPHWSSVATLTTTYYGDQARDSPLRQRATATTAQVALTYSF